MHQEKKRENNIISYATTPSSSPHSVFAFLALFVCTYTSLPFYLSLTTPKHLPFLPSPPPFLLSHTPNPPPPLRVKSSPSGPSQSHTSSHSPSQTDYSWHTPAASSKSCFPPTPPAGASPH